MEIMATSCLLKTSMYLYMLNTSMYLYMLALSGEVYTLHSTDRTK